MARLVEVQLCVAACAGVVEFGRVAGQLERRIAVASDTRCLFHVNADSGRVSVTVHEVPVGGLCLHRHGVPRPGRRDGCGTGVDVDVLIAEVVHLLQLQSGEVPETLPVRVGFRRLDGELNRSVRQRRDAGKARHAVRAVVGIHDDRAGVGAIHGVAGGKIIGVPVDALGGERERVQLRRVESLEPRADARLREPQFGDLRVGGADGLVVDDGPHRLELRRLSRERPSRVGIIGGGGDHEEQLDVGGVPLAVDQPREHLGLAFRDDERTLVPPRRQRPLAGGRNVERPAAERRQRHQSRYRKHETYPLFHAIVLLRRKYIIFLLSFILSFSFVNCGGGGGGDDDGPVINKNSLAVSTSSITFDAAASQQTVNVTANCDWKVTCSATWLTINPTSGNANATLTLSAQENTITTREATVTVTGGGFTRTISVTQRGADVKLTVSPQTLEFEYKEEEKTVALTTNTTWTVSSDQSWCTVSKSSGNNNENIAVKVSQNNSPDKRTANVIITAGNKTETVTVTQNGGTLPVVNSLSVMDITAYEATCTFDATSDEAITECGVCYSTTNHTPTTSDSKEVSSTASSSSSKSVKLANLTKKTTYYVRAYATSAIGTTYSDVKTFTTKSGTPEEGDNNKPSYSKKR